MSKVWNRAPDRPESGDDGVPKFGRKACAWFARSLRAKLVELKVPYRMRGDEIEPVVQWFSTDPKPYIEWNDSDEFRGRGWSCGAWVIDWNKVKSTLSVAIEEIRAAAESARYTSLDDWLRAEIGGTLAGGGDEGGAHCLPKKLRRELRAAARARRKKLPRICRTCGEPFMPTCNRALRCSNCIDAA